jgi:drug/metabolite transporter (DMT)-like permease
MTAKDKERRKGVLALIALAFVFASMGIFARYLSESFTVLQQTYLRIFTAFILGLAFFYKDIDFRKIRSLSTKEWLILILRSFSLYLIGVTLISKGIIISKYSNVSFIAALPMTSVLGFILLKEKVTRQKIGYIVLGFIGVLLIAVTDYKNIFNWGFGEFLALIASVGFALSYVARKWHSKLLNNKEITVIIFLISSILLFITSIGLGEGMPSTSNFSNFIIIILLISALFNVFNLLLTNYGFQKVDAVLGGNILMLEIVFAVCIGLILYSEIPTLKEALGGVIIAVSAYQMNKLSKN